MNHPDRLSGLIDSLAAELGSAQAGSDRGQFPILDLLGNIREEAAERPELAQTHNSCAEAWQRMVGVVESGKPFSASDLAWLNELLASLKPNAAPLEPAALTASPSSAPSLPPQTPPAEEQEQPLLVNVAEDGDLLREFIAESREHLDNIEQGVLVLETQPLDKETLNTVFRAFHTFKGGAGFLNLMPINRLAHVLESLLDLARQGRLVIDAPVIELILSGRDVLKKFLDEIDGQVGGSCPSVPIFIPTSSLKQSVQAVINRVNSGLPGSVEPSPCHGDSQVGTSAQAALIVSPCAEAPPEAETTLSSVPSPIPAAVAAEQEPAPTQSGEHSSMVKIDTGKLDGLLDLVGEMVIAQSLVAQDVDQLTQVDPRFARNLTQLGRITKDLQRVSMSLRMVPIRGVFQKMTRVVRDICAKQGKKVQLLTSGEDTELDRRVVEELNDPLLHMIRNSMDHGIEAPEKRVASGKQPIGALHLRAYHQGGNIVVEIEDDGAGLNKERILAKAIERGLTTASASHTEDEISAFIFMPGFSTAEVVTDLSGRGVGLDVVRRNIERLRGRVDISSTQGKGTRFKITLPLTLAIIDALIVKIGAERYIIPTLSVRESFRPQPGMISRVQGRAEVVNVRGRLIPLLRLRELFGIKADSDDSTQGIVVVAQSGTSIRCLLVDGLLHKQEVVIKNLNDMMVHKHAALAGAAILGDGRVGLILDVNALVHLSDPSFSKAA